MDRRTASLGRWSIHWSRGAAGFTMLEILFALGLAGILVAIAVPQMLSGLDRSRGLAAARYLASRMALARALAVSHSANVALRFQTSDGNTRFAAFVDGNGNGVRAADIQALIDPMVEAEVSLGDLFPGVTIGLDPDAGAGGAVQVGASSMLSFSASGTATAGSVYVRGRDGSQLAVRVLGTTARTRVLRYVASTGTWVQAF